VYVLVLGVVKCASKCELAEPVRGSIKRGGHHLNDSCANLDTERD